MESATQPVAARLITGEPSSHILFRTPASESERMGGKVDYAPINRPSDKDFRLPQNSKKSSRHLQIEKNSDLNEKGRIKLHQPVKAIAL